MIFIEAKSPFFTSRHLSSPIILLIIPKVKYFNDIFRNFFRVFFKRKNSATNGFAKPFVALFFLLKNTRKKLRKISLKYLTLGIIRSIIGEER